MATIVTRSGKGSALTHTEADANLTNLNTDKIEGLGSSTDNAIVRFDGTGGKTIQNTSTTTINDEGDIVVAGTTPTITIGDGGTEDATLQFNGVKDFYIASDDSADKLVIGEGSTVGTNSILTITDDTVTLGDGAAVDTAIVFDGNAKDFYVALDDSADKLLIGEGSTVGTNPILSITDDTVTLGDGAAVDTAIVFDGNAKDFYVALDDSADKLLIGEGSTVGTNPILSITDDTVTLGDGAAVDTSIVFDGNALDFHVALDDSADDLLIGTGATVGSNTLISINGDGSETKFNQPKITLGDGTAEDTYLNFDGNAQDFRIGIDDGTDTLEVGVGTAHGTTTALKVDSSAQVTVGVKLIMPDVTAGKILVGDGTSYEEVAVSGDIGLASDGAATIQSAAVETAMVNANVVTGQTAEATVAGDDVVLIYDTSATALRKMTRSNFVSGVGTGDVSGPGSAVDNAIARFSGTGGKTVQNSNVTISDDPPVVKIGDGVAEDIALKFDGNEKDFHIGLDDSANTLVIGEGSTIGTNEILSITDDKVTIGDGATVDTYLNFDGNAADFRIGIDDGTDKLEIGGGVAHGTAAGIAMDVNGDMTLGGGIVCSDEVISRPRFTDYAETVVDAGTKTAAFNLDLESGNVQTLTMSGGGTFNIGIVNALSSHSNSLTILGTNLGSCTATFYAGAHDGGGNKVYWADGDDTTNNLLTASGTDVLTLTTFDGGTKFYGFIAGKGMTNT